VPQIGEDGAELLSRLLGCDDARLAKLAQSGVLHGKAKSVPEPVAG
jgi:hypothetical protein